MDPPEPVRQQVVPHTESRFKRNYVWGLILSVVTLGFYGLWWHWTVHKELCGHLRRPMRGEHIWVVFGLLYIALVAIAVMGWLKMLDVSRGGEGVPIAFLGVVTFAAIGAVLSALVALTLFIIYVLGQYEVIREAKGALDLPLRGGSVRFLPLFLAGSALWFMPIVDSLINALGVALVVLAYRYMQEDYNEIWDAVARWQSRPVSHAPPTTSPYPR